MRVPEAHVARLGYTGRVVVRHASSSEIRAGLKALLARSPQARRGAADETNHAGGRQATVAPSLQDGGGTVTPAERAAAWERLRLGLKYAHEHGVDTIGAIETGSDYYMAHVGCAAPEALEALDAYEALRADDEADSPRGKLIRRLREEAKDLQNAIDLNVETIRILQARRCGTCRWWGTVGGVLLDGGTRFCACGNAASECCDKRRKWSAQHGCPQWEAQS